MIIPWYIYTPLSLIVTCLTLYLCVKDNHITTPPSPEEINRSVERWKTGYPISEESVRIAQANTHSDNGVNPHRTNTTTANEIAQGSTSEQKATEQSASDSTNNSEHAPATPLAPVTPTINLADLITSEVAPALDSLLTPDIGTKQLIQYAEQMLANNRPQIARIAHERVIDKAKDATPEDRKSSAAAISKLISQTPLWNPDSSTRKSLNIQIILNANYKDQSERIITELQNMVLNASDGTVAAKIKLTSGEQPLSSLRISTDTPLVTFTINQTADLDTKIPAALYFAVRSKNNLVQKLTSIPNLPTHLSAKQALNTYITRLAWVNAANNTTADTTE